MQRRSCPGNCASEPGRQLFNLIRRDSRSCEAYSNSGPSARSTTGNFRPLPERDAGARKSRSATNLVLPSLHIVRKEVGIFGVGVTSAGHGCETGNQQSISSEKGAGNLQPSNGEWQFWSQRQGFPTPSPSTIKPRAVVWGAVWQLYAQYARRHVANPEEKRSDRCLARRLADVVVGSIHRIGAL